MVCGHITYESVTYFLKDFLHPDREKVEEVVVFLHRSEPDLEFEGNNLQFTVKREYFECSNIQSGLLKRRHTQIKYFQGSLMNPGDLERAKVRSFPSESLLLLTLLAFLRFVKLTPVCFWPTNIARTLTPRMPVRKNKFCIRVRKCE